MSDIPSFHLHMPTAVEFGTGVAARLGQRARRLSIRHAFLVTDGALATGPACAAAQESLAAADISVTVYDGVILDPDEASIERAAQAYRASGADGLVALGGGSAMDTAKALGV